MTTNSRFTWKHFPSASTVFSCAMLIFGEREAVLIDGVITLLDGKVLPEATKRSEKTLTTIYISILPIPYAIGLCRKFKAGVIF